MDVEDTTDNAIRAEARSWYEDNWDPDLNVSLWYQRLAESGWGYPTWPVGLCGRALSARGARIVREERRRVGALAPNSGIGPTLLTPMLLAHGTPEQKARFLWALATRNETCCQMLSEPDAGSDLANVRTKAVRDGDEWVVTGSKIWTSNADIVDFGMLLARTNSDVPKHRGLTFFLIRRDQPGVTVVPLRQMTGDARFNEVFFNEARVSAADVLGDIEGGWAVTLTFLAHEKNSYNPASHEGGPFGKVDMALSAGEVVARERSRTSAASQGRGVGAVLDSLIAHSHQAGSATVRQRQAALFSMRRAMNYTNDRVASAGASLGAAVGPMSKLTVSELTRRQRDLGLQALGPAGMLSGADAPSASFAHFALHTPSLSIAGGTDEIQRNSIGERVLGLPAEPRLDRDVPFKDLLQQPRSEPKPQPERN